MYKKGDLVLVKLHPSFGFELKKYRPSLVLFDPVDPRFITILPISTKSRDNTHRYEYPVSSFRLKSESWVLVWHPLTIDIGRVTTKLGAITKSEYKKAVKALVTLMK